MVYIIKYYRTGMLASVLPFLFPDGRSLITDAKTSDKAVKNFEKKHKGYKEDDIS